VTPVPEAIEVRKVPIHSVSDSSELTRLIDDGVLEASRVIAIIGKTEGNGGVNDYTRILADRSFREAGFTHGRMSGTSMTLTRATIWSRPPAASSRPGWAG
jgi:ring-opening amidohydrolase-like protein